MSVKNKNELDALARLSRMPGHLLRRANQTVVALFNEECRDLGITPVQFASIAAIASVEAVDVTRLSQIIGFDKATLGSVIDRLEKRGIVRREPHPQDRRIKLVVLTKEGYALLEETLPLAERSQERFLENLNSKEQATLLSLLSKVSGFPESAGALFEDTGV
ncbi:MAG: MarR family transcriptional regulator [Sneathiellales bacterium]|nr:MarR family transcriptional regulator [Sneathiellales bacterium]